MTKCGDEVTVLKVPFSLVRFDQVFMFTVRRGVGMEEGERGGQIGQGYVDE